MKIDLTKEEHDLIYQKVKEIFGYGSVTTWEELKIAHGILEKLETEWHDDETTC